jgi:hypothetical protein
MDGEPSEDRFVVFDARTLPPAVSTDWTSERLERYLVRLDVSTVLSVDPWVWPRAVLQTSSSNLGWVGVGGSLSPDPSDLRRRMHGGERSKAALVAISVPTEAAGDMGIWDIPAPQYENPGASWTFAGYDIADAGFSSGLSNCGYRHDEAVLIRERFAADLNDFHLFVDQAVAEEFRRVTDRRVAEHTPFCVFGLYTLND